jgi:hypothetical protein
LVQTSWSYAISDQVEECDRSALYQPADLVVANQYELSVQVNGRSGLFIDVSNEPEYLIVEYVLRDESDGTPHRRKFELAQIRGRRREMTIELP